MIVEVGNTIIYKINTLPFVDKYAGVVRTLTYQDKNTSGATVKKTFPADCRMTFQQCEQESRYLDLCPDSSKKSVIYLEDTGLRLVSKEGNYLNWRAQYNLVVWLNLPKFGFTGCSYSSTAMLSILKKLPVRPFNSGQHHLINIQAVGQQPKTTNPFSRYSYDESVNQFLMYPFDFFVLLLDVSFQNDLRCVNIASLSPALECVDK